MQLVKINTENKIAVNQYSIDFGNDFPDFKKIKEIDKEIADIKKVVEKKNNQTNK